jgi:uncharacterized protein
MSAWGRLSSPNLRHMAYKRKILSIDGGGIRGIIPGLILTEIEQRTGKPISALFDLVAGTSTGGILALGLVKPHPENPAIPHYKAADLVAIYKDYGKAIFYEPPAERLTSVDDLVRPKYSADGRDKVLFKFFDNALLEHSLKEVFLASYDIDNRFPVFFTSNLNKQETDSREFRRICAGLMMRQAAMATSAAPTYFEPYRIPTTTHRTNNSAYVLIDGGVFANNPTALAVIETMSSYRQQAMQQGKPAYLPIDQLLVVSLGTGSLTRSYPYDRAQNWGILGWIQPLINITLDGTSEVVTVQMEQMLSPSQFYRFQGFLDRGKGNDEMDKVSPQNIAELESLAQSIIYERRQDIDRLCEQLLEPNDAD